MSNTPDTSPERIWLRWEPGVAVTQGPLTRNPDFTCYRRADLPTTLAAALAVPEVKAVKRALERAEAAFADISEGEPERDDRLEIRFCKRRANEALQIARTALAALETKVKE